MREQVGMRSRNSISLQWPSLPARSKPASRYVLDLAASLFDNRKSQTGILENLRHIGHIERSENIKNIMTKIKPVKTLRLVFDSNEIGQNRCLSTISY